MDYIIKQLTSENEQKREVVDFLKLVDREFAVPLTQKVNLDIYVEKLFKTGYIFAIIVNRKIEGIICGYANDMENKTAFESAFVVTPSLRGSGAAVELYKRQLQHCKKKGMKELKFTTNRKNVAAIRFYQKVGAQIVEEQCTDAEIAYSVVF